MIHVHGVPLVDWGGGDYNERNNLRKQAFYLKVKMSLAVFHHSLLGGRFPQFHRISIKIVKATALGCQMDLFLCGNRNLKLYSCL